MSVANISILRRRSPRPWASSSEHNLPHSDSGHPRNRCHSVKFHKLEPSMAVWGFQHGDLHADALEADDAVYPVTFDRHFAEHRQAKLDEELGRGSEAATTMPTFSRR